MVTNRHTPSHETMKHRGLFRTERMIARLQQSHHDRGLSIDLTNVQKLEPLMLHTSIPIRSLDSSTIVQKKQ